MSHKESDELLSDLDKLNQLVKVGDRFFHYKHSNQFYKIIAIGFIEDTETPCVVYEAEDADMITWVRTQNEFFAKVKLDDETEVDRFTKVV